MNDSVDKILRYPFAQIIYFWPKKSETERRELHLKDKTAKSSRLIYSCLRIKFSTWFG